MDGRNLVVIGHSKPKYVNLNQMCDGQVRAWRAGSGGWQRAHPSITFQQNVSILFCFMLYWVDGRRPDEEKTHLDQLRQSRTAAFRDVQRAQILWRYHAGETVSQIASARKDDAQERSEVD
jgi:hypothetical protein